MNVDVFMFGLEPLVLLLWWGDLAAMRAGAAKVLHAHRCVLDRVQRNETSAEMCASPTCRGEPFRGPTLAA